MDLELFSAISKYPFIHNGEMIDSKELNQNKTCIKQCQEKDCITYFLDKEENGLEYVCSKGYNNYLFSYSKFKYILNGLIFENNTTVPTGRKEVRKGWIVDRADVYLFVAKLLEIEKHIEKRVFSETEKNFSMFHDFKTSMSIFYSCTQDIINELPGDTFLQKLEHSDKSFKDLYNALELVTSQLRMLDVILNPKSIEFGNKKKINLYRLFEKIKILFGHLNKVDVSIVAEGRVKDCYCYESIEFIPLILLDNALKYSVKDKEVEIKFEQKYDRLKVIVKNIGPLVSDVNEKRIFDKFFRDEAAISFSKSGIGMGLWIAQEILKKHESELVYYKDKKETRVIGLNIFEFDIKTEFN